VKLLQELLNIQVQESLDDREAGVNKHYKGEYLPLEFTLTYADFAWDSNINYTTDGGDHPKKMYILPGDKVTLEQAKNAFEKRFSSITWLEKTV
jgi:hypothetical protein